LLCRRTGRAGRSSPRIPPRAATRRRARPCGSTSLRRRPRRQQRLTTTAPSTTTAPPEPATVPDVVGDELADAAKAFGDEGLKVAVRYVPVERAAGRVVAQAQPARDRAQATATPCRSTSRRGRIRRRPPRYPMSPARRRATLARASSARASRSWTSSSRATSPASSARSRPAAAPRSHAARSCPLRRRVSYFGAGSSL
jgi:hypothetical protein